MSPSPSALPVPIAIFASGGGSNAQAIIQYFKPPAVARIALVVCNKPAAGVLAVAGQEGIETLLIEKELFFKGDAYVQQLKQQGIEWIVLAGFLWKVPPALIAAYPKRIINIHPALLPRFGGKGMYGRHVHEAVLQAGEVESGITIHYVNEHYDEGDIIFQTACPVLATDSAATVAARVLTLEHLYYPQVIERLVKESRE